MYFTEVILPLALPRTFTYQVTEDEFHFLQPGMRVVVPFGKSKMYTALVLDLHQNPPQLYEAKEIHQISLTTPLKTDFRLQQQIKASSGSIMDNIAEGFERDGNTDLDNI